MKKTCSTKTITITAKLTIDQKFTCEEDQIQMAITKRKSERGGRVREELECSDGSDMREEEKRG